MPDVSSNLATLGTAGWIVSPRAVGPAVQPQRALWADRASYQSLGTEVLFTDFGGGQAGAGGGTVCLWNGTRFKPHNNIALLDRLDTTNGPSTTGATPYNLNPNAATIQAGQIGLYDAVETLIVVNKSAGVETATFELRLGSAFTVADRLISSFTLTAGELNGRFFFRWKRTGSNTLLPEASGNPQVPFGTSTAASPVELTLAAGTFDGSALRVSVWSSLNGAAETVSMPGYRSVLEATDS